MLLHCKSNQSLINIFGKTLCFKSVVTLGLSLLCSCSFTYHYTRLHTFFGNFWPSIKLLILISKETKETLKFQVLSNQMFLKYVIPLYHKIHMRFCFLIALISLADFKFYQEKCHWIVF